MEIKELSFIIVQRKLVVLVAQLEPRNKAIDLLHKSKLN
jgi:hypothetical protein